MIIMLTSFISASVAETGCFCEDDLSSHFSEEHTSGPTEKNDNATANHCSHTCSQCHFAALCVPIFNMVNRAPSFVVHFVATVQSPRSVPQVLYRPPIA